MGIADGQEWDRFAGLDRAAGRARGLPADAPFNAEGRRRTEAPRDRHSRRAAQAERQGVEHAGRLRQDPERDRRARTASSAERIVTTSPDVTVSTNLGAWVNRRGLFGHTEAEDVFRELKVVSAQLWRKSPRGQHIELGIAENNLFILLAALGPQPRAVRRAAAADRHALRSRSSPAASMR